MLSRGRSSSCFQSEKQMESEVIQLYHHLHILKPISNVRILAVNHQTYLIIH